MTQATIGAVIIMSPFSCGDVLGGYNGRNACLPVGRVGRAGRKNVNIKNPTYGRQAK
jgi:hypothetical protein